MPEALESNDSASPEESVSIEVVDNSVASRFSSARVGAECCSASNMEASFLICLANTLAHEGDLPKCAASPFSVLKHFLHLLLGHLNITMASLVFLLCPVAFAIKTLGCFLYGAIGELLVTAKTKSFGKGLCVPLIIYE